MTQTGKRTSRSKDRSSEPPSKKQKTSKSPSRSEKEKEEAERFLGDDFDSSKRRTAAENADANRKEILSKRGRSKSPTPAKTPQKETTTKKSPSRTKSPAKKVTKAKSPPKKTTTRSKSPKRKKPTRSKSPIRVAVKPVRSGLKRMSTMEETSLEAMAFLEAEGGKELLESSSTLPETRGRTQARAVLEEMMSDDTEKIDEEFDEEAERNRLHTVFQLIDYERSKIIGEEEMAELMRSMGKRPLKRKVRKLLDDIKPKEKGKVTEQEFVNFMVAKRSAKFTKKKEKKIEEPKRRKSTSPKRKSPSRATSPKKASSPRSTRSTSPKKPSSSPRKSTSPKSSTSGVRKATAPVSSIPAPSTSVPSFTPTPSTPVSKSVAVSSVPKHDLLRFYSTVANTKTYGLGRDLAFSDFVVLVYIGAHSDIIEACIKKILFPKRFQVKVTTDLGTFVKELPEANEALIFSGSIDDSKGSKQDWSSVSEKDFVDAIKSYHNSGRGIGLFASGTPFVAEANAVLSALFEIKLGGSEDGKNTISVKPNPVMSGITNLYEGVKVAYPEMDNTEGFKVLATSSSNHPTIFIKDVTKQFPSTGRIVVDTGYSKILNIGKSDVAKYFCNLSVWLLMLDYRIRKNAYLKGTLIPKEDIEVCFIIYYFISLLILYFSIFGNIIMVDGIIMMKQHQNLLKKNTKNILIILVKMMFVLFIVDIGII